MNITNSNYSPVFKRAFSSQERKVYDKLLNDSKKELGLKDTTAIIFDFNVPSEKGKNTGIGSLWGNNALKICEFLKSNALVTSVQTGPEGKIINGNRSPYSGTNFALGEHIIDTAKLTEKKYGSLLDEDDIIYADKNYPGDKIRREYKTDYDYVLGKNNDGIQEQLLKKAFEHFNAPENIGKNKKLHKEYAEFKEKNSKFLEKEFLFDVLTKEYGNDDYLNWNITDKNLCDKSTDENVKKARISELKNKYAYDEEFSYFKQFIADKQQKEARKNLNDIGIKLYGDCLIGYSKSEVWSHPECFTEGLYYGGPDPGCGETNNIQTWQLTAPDYTKIGKCEKIGDTSQLDETGKFFLEKYKSFFEKYDGIRTDAAWQFITPFLYTEENGTYRQKELPEKDSGIFNIMKTAAKDVLGNNFDENNPENIMLELVGMSAGKSREMTINKYPHLYTTAYSEYDESPAALKKKGYKDGMFYIGAGCHDNESLVEQAKNLAKRNIQLPLIIYDYKTRPELLKFNVPEYKELNDEEQSREDFRTAKFAEIFTTSKQFFTLPDMFGMGERINISGKTSPDNWSVRIPSDYEKFYHSQLSNGYGLNMPKALANAMVMTGKGNEELIDKCLKAAEILRSKGPLTQKEADEAQKRGQLKDILV